MKKSFHPKSGIALVVFLSLLAIFTISALESVLFYEKFKRVETFEALHNKINHVSRVVARLGNTLDIVVVGELFEQTTINILSNDINRIDAEINRLSDKYTNDPVISANKFLSDELKGMPVEWREIYKDINKFHPDMSSDEVMLIHSDIDVDVLALDEKLDKISSGITAALKRVFSEIKILLMVSLGAFVLLLTAEAVYIYLRFISPMKKLEIAAINMASEDGESRFSTKIPGVFGRVAFELNVLLDAASGRRRKLKEEMRGLSERIADGERAIGLLGDFFSEAGRSFNIDKLFRDNLRGVSAMTGACGVAVYCLEDERLRLKAEASGDGNNTVFPEFLPTESMGDGKGTSLALTGPGVLSSRGAKWMRSFAISPSAQGDYGRLILLFHDSPDESRDVFTRSLVSALGTSIAFVERLWEEHGAKEDCLTLINQFPLGIAVFNKDAQCISANLILHRFLGATPGFDFIRDYRFTEDDVLNSHALDTTIYKAFDGFITEFIINYDPNAVKRYGFMGQVRDLRVKSVPLYDSGGKITNIALIYEDITVTDEHDSGEDSKRL